MSKTMILLVWLFVLVFASTNPITARKQSFVQAEKDPTHPLLIAGYLANYSFDKFNFSALPFLNRIYYFGIAPTDSGEFFVSAEDSIRISRVKAALTKRQELYMVIGGWTQSKNIPVMAETEEKRNKYISAVIKYCKANHLDGIDLDYEDYPFEVDATKFFALTKAFGEAAHKNGMAFTVALGTSEKKLQMALKAQPYVDEINLMSYGKFDEAGNQAPMDLFQKWLDNYLKAGIQKSKLIVGVPFYGKRLPDTSNHSPIALTYADIVQKTHPAVSVNKYGTYSYNGVELMKQKTQYLINNKFKGIMSWELSQDLNPTDSLSLLHTIFTTNFKR